MSEQVASQSRKYLSVTQIAEAAGVTKTAVMKLINAKSIKAEKVGWVWVIPASELDKIISLAKSKPINNHNA